MQARRRILFVAESVTLAQIVRLVTLARGLDTDEYEVHFASGHFPELVFGPTEFVRHSLRTLTPEAADQALRSGRRLYEKATLLEYIDAELRLIEAVRPDLVVGDFRLTLSTSAELARVPSGALINAYWSPFALRDSFPVPDHPVVRWLGEEMTARYFPKALPMVFRHFASPLDAARRQHGLSEVAGLLEMLTLADYVLYPDDPWLTPVAGAPSSHVFLGPVLWQPDVVLARAEQNPGQELLEIDDDPLVYVTLGSSGDVRLVPLLLDVLGQLGVPAVLATADRVELRNIPPNVRASRFVRGSEMAQRAQLVVSNGGSATGYQALSAGTPVLGLPSNLDQYLATQAIVRAGAGTELKARQATRESLARALELALRDAALKTAARQVASHFHTHDAQSVFQSWVKAAIGAEQRRAVHSQLGEHPIRTPTLTEGI